MQASLVEAGLNATFNVNGSKYIIATVGRKKLERYIEATVQFITNVKRQEILDRILQERFYYEDEEERQQIIHIVASMCKGQREELISLTQKVDEHTLVKESVQSSFHHKESILFDSLLTFRLKTYEEALMNYLFVAIDEYKMEQEYQMFLHMLRDYLRIREPRKKEMHLLIDRETKFFDEQLQEVSQETITSLIDRRLLSNHPVYIDSAVIAPLLSIAPKKIHLYTNDEEAPLIRTLKNIFEERLRICALSTFEK